MHGRFAWNELLTPDVDAARSFYERLLGWSFSSTPMAGGGDYWVASLNGQPVAGLMAVEAAGPGTPPQWFAYIAVDDIDGRCAAIAASGGAILRPPFPVPDVGRIAVVMDPQKVAFGLLQPDRS